MFLFILTSDGGDGSYYPKFVLDPVVIAMLEAAYDRGVMDCENGYGVDGDGFHYEKINVPEGSTAESLGIPYYSLLTSESVAARFNFSEEDYES